MSVPAADAAGVWLPADAGGLVCGVAHAPGGGRLDESARRLSHPELAVAARLAAEGHAVTSVAEGPGRGPVADLVVCGEPVEVKSLLTRAERPDGRPATWRTLYNRLVSAADQAGIAVVATAGSGLAEADAAAGVRAFFERGRAGRVRAVRILGDGFDLAWRSEPGRRVAPDPGAARAGWGREAAGVLRAPPTGDRAGGARPAPTSRPSARRAPVPLGRDGPSLT